MGKRDTDQPGSADKGQMGDGQAAFFHDQGALAPNGKSGATKADLTADRIDPTNPAGHRQRLRDRFLNGGADALPDYELLELVLFRALPRRDTKALAKQLLATFNSFSGVLNASERRLLEIKGVGQSVITELKLIRAASLRLIKTELTDKPCLSSFDDVLNYVHAAQAFEDREYFRILFLDKKNKLIADEVQGQGTVDHTPVYIREVVKRGLELAATALILVHNHPSGDPTPSRTDIDMTKMISSAAKPLGLTVHDHIIVGRTGHTSFRELRLL